MYTESTVTTKTNKHDRPIAVFDSGVGGISILRELKKLMPHEDFIYYGDCANAPYGTKSVDEIERLTLSASKHLYEKDIKCLVIACNTATAVCISKLREIYTDIPIIGVEPALKPAVNAKPGGNIIVMATPVTLHQEKFISLLSKYGEHSKIVMLPCPGIVELIESGETEGKNIEKRVRELFAPFDVMKLDAVVLGCTHYPFIKSTVLRVIGKNAVLFDGGEGTARETLKQLIIYGYERSPSQTADGEVVFINSSPTKDTSFMQKLYLAQ